MFSYVVRCSFTEASGRDAFVEWLRSTHIADVRRAGALEAEIVYDDADPLTVESRYHFASRAAYATYEKEHAPRLRAEGLATVKRLGITVTMSRTTGEVLRPTL